MKAVLLVAALALASGLVSACTPKSYTMQGKDADQMLRDEQQCRSQMRAQAQTQRNIDDNRRSVFEGERERFGQQDVYTTMDNQGYKYNLDRLVERCMEARGWAPKQQNGITTWWNRVSTFNTPLGK